MIEGMGLGFRVFLEVNAKATKHFRRPTPQEKSKVAAHERQGPKFPKSLNPKP